MPTKNRLVVNARKARSQSSTASHQFDAVYSRLLSYAVPAVGFGLILSFVVFVF